MLQNFADLEGRGGVENGALAAHRKGPDDEPYFGLFGITAWQICDRRVCGVDVSLRHRIFPPRPHARLSGLACLRRFFAGMLSMYIATRFYGTPQDSCT